MNPTDSQQRRRQAERRRDEQRRRTGQLRGRVVAISLISFVLLWGVVFAQMATGNDPVLGAGNRRATAAVSEAATTDPEEVELELVEPEPAEAEIPAIEPEPEPEPEPVTTSQS